MSSLNEKGVNEVSEKGDVLRQGSQTAEFLQSEVLVNPDLISEAIDGENHEHNQGFLAAVKAHPWACFWAFLMSFTIVSPCLRIRHHCHQSSKFPNSGDCLPCGRAMANLASGHGIV